MSENRKRPSATNESRTDAQTQTCLSGDRGTGRSGIVRRRVSGAQGVLHAGKDVRGSIEQHQGCDRSLFGRIEGKWAIRSRTTGDHQRPPRRGDGMNSLPMLKPRELIRALEKAGFGVVRKSRGSHWQLSHPDGRRTTIAVHRGRDIGPGLLRKILRGAELTVDELMGLL